MTDSGHFSPEVRLVVDYLTDEREFAARSLGHPPMPSVWTSAHEIYTQILAHRERGWFHGQTHKPSVLDVLAALDGLVRAGYAEGAPDTGGAILFRRRQ